MSEDTYESKSQWGDDSKYGLEWVRDRLAMYPHGRAAEVSNANN